MSVLSLRSPRRRKSCTHSFAQYKGPCEHWLGWRPFTIFSQALTDSSLQRQSFVAVEAKLVHCRGKRGGPGALAVIPLYLSLYQNLHQTGHNANRFDTLRSDLPPSLRKLDSCPPDCASRHPLNNRQDHNAALALVSTRAPASDSSTPKSTHHHTTKSSHGVEHDPDLERALDLIELHQGVKMTHVQGQDQGLTQARKDVDTVLAELEDSDAERASER